MKTLSLSLKLSQGMDLNMNSEPLIKVCNVSKSFGIVKALVDVSFEVYPGEIVGLIGENGSGKSTVSSIIAGMKKKDQGEIYFKGQLWVASTMQEALDKGIAMIVQETGTIANIPVVENVFLGEASKYKGKFGLINRKQMLEDARDILKLVSLENINPSVITSNYDFTTRKLIEIAKAIAKQPDVLIVDETSTSLNQTARETLYRLMNEFKANNKGVIFISHDLEEVMDKCDRLNVLKDGHFVQTLEKKDFNEDEVKKLIVGRDISGNYYRNDYDVKQNDEVVLELKKATIVNQLDNVSLQLHKGEILGIGGLSHCGMHQIGKVLFGNMKLDSGKALVYGSEIKDEEHAMKNGIGYVAKDRDTESLSLSASISDNISIGGIEKFVRNKFFVLYSDEKKYVNKQIEDLKIKCFSSNQQVSTLSGGNKQKVVFGKWVGRDSNILILDCPTRGVDIGVKQFMYQLMNDMKKQGKSIILISEELSELIGMSDRILILKDGSIKKEFLRNKDLKDAEIINYMI